MLPSPRPSSISRHFHLPLVLLCAVQSCERFAFLAMLPLFVPYANERHSLPVSSALLVLAGFQALSYLGGLPAGWLADRKLGVRASTALGAALLAGAYGLLAADRSAPLLLALGIMVVGHSLFRPGLHVLIAHAVGSDERARERGFLWHYLAANLGYAAGALFGEWAHASHGWASLFIGASTSSLVGGALLAVGMPWLRSGADTAPKTTERRSSAPTAPSMFAVWLLCGVAVIFWLTAQQAGSSLAVFAATNTQPQIAIFGHSLSIGPGHLASLHGLMVIAMLPVFLFLHGRQRAGDTSTTNKLIWGYVATSAAFVLMAAAALRGGDLGRVSASWLVGCYVFLSFAEILLAPLGVSLVTQLAPKDRATQAVGLWFAGCALGSGLAGALGLCWDRWPHHRYFAALALLPLGAAAVLLSRRRQLDWLTALASGTSPQPAVEQGMATMSPTPNPMTAPRPSQLSTYGTASSHVRLTLAGLAISIPGVLVVAPNLPLPVRGTSALLCGMAVLLCGPYLFSRLLVRWARYPSTAPR